jgi:hypothetical protein
MALRAAVANVVAAANCSEHAALTAFNAIDPSMDEPATTTKVAASMEHAWAVDMSESEESWVVGDAWRDGPPVLKEDAPKDKVVPELNVVLGQSDFTEYTRIQNKAATVVPAAIDELMPQAKERVRAGGKKYKGFEKIYSEPVSGIDQKVSSKLRRAVNNVRDAQLDTMAIDAGKNAGMLPDVAELRKDEIIRIARRLGLDPTLRVSSGE